MFTSLLEDAGREWLDVEISVNMTVTHSEQTFLLVGQGQSLSE